MEGAPNSPNDAYVVSHGATPDATPEMTICPACGAAVRMTARFCGACGADLIAAVAAAQGNAQIATPAPAQEDAPNPAPAPDPLVAAADAPIGDAQGAAGATDAGAAGVAPAPAPFAPGEGKVCGWCGAANALNASACSACGASFPTPEGTEAMERAAKARIDDMQEQIQSKRMRGGWWPFRAR